MALRACFSQVVNECVVPTQADMDDAATTIVLTNKE